MLLCICMLTKRTNILFSEDLWKKLSRLAQIRKTSVGELVRSAVEQSYLQGDHLEKRKQAIDGTLSKRIITKGKINYQELINYGRKY